jgi:fluoride exporter
MSERISTLLAVAGGGAIGAVARYLLSSWAVRKFPMGTLVVNVAGCLLIGLVVGSVQERNWLTPVWRHFLIAGFCGGLTTFSTFGYQSIELAQEGKLGLAGLNVAGNLLLGFAAVAVGLMVARAVARV